MADRTRPIVRLSVTDRMVTKGYRKGVYEWVTKGIGDVDTNPVAALATGDASASTVRECILADTWRRLAQQNGRLQAGL
jgi:hypothetical protein